MWLANSDFTRILEELFSFLSITAAKLSDKQKTLDIYMYLLYTVQDNNAMFVLHLQIF